MDIFYSRISKIKKLYDKAFLQKYADIELKNEKRFYEYTIGRFLTKNAAKNYYKAEYTDIIINDNGKPVFKNSDLYFSISHSNDIVIVCFDKFPVGLDLEYIKPRNLVKLSAYFKKQFNSLDDFYKFWTLKEAAYKLGVPPLYIYSGIFSEKYYLSVASEQQSNLKCEILPFIGE